MTFTFRLWGCVVAALALGAAPFLAGCNQRSAEKGEIKRLFADYEDSSNQSNGELAARVVTAATFEHYEELIRLGLDGDEKKVRALGAMDKLEVLRMRSRATRADLKKLDGRAYVEYANSKGWYATGREARATLTLEDIRFEGQTASAMLMVDGQWTGFRVRFAREEGAWKLDETSLFTGWNKRLRKEAHDQEVTEDELVLDMLADVLGKPAPESVWKPM